MYAAADGVVIPSNYDSSAGNSIIIRHSQHNVCTGYAHLKTGSLLVSSGQSVRMGQQIATSNNTGFSTGSHLHFEVIPGTTGALAGNGSQNHDPDQWIDYNLDPSNPNPIPEDDDMAYLPNLLMNNTGVGSAVGIAVFANGYVKPVNIDQWNAFKMAGSKTYSVVVPGHWAFHLSTAAEVRGAVGTSQARVSSAEARTLSAESSEPDYDADALSDELLLND